jgi:subtilisin family serine protease
MTPARPSRPARLLALVLLVGLVPGLVALTSPTAAAAPAPAARYVVELAPAGAARTASDLRRTGIRPTTTYLFVLDGFAATLTPAQVSRLRADRRVLSVRPDQVVHATATETRPPWGLDRIDQRATSGDRRYVYGTTGRGVRAYVVDTGIRLTHHQFGGRASSGYDFVDHDAKAQDCNGHGTHVAGTLGGTTYGVAKQVSLVALRVLNCNGDGYESDVAAALDWVLAHRGSAPAVVNMSIGGDPSPVIDDAIATTVAAGVPVVVAAGNDETDACTTSPARAPEALTVGASTRTDQRADFSNYGSCVDLYAPGEGILSAWSDSDTSSVEADGTSMASPHVAGAVARYLQAHPKATPAQVRAALVTVATPEVKGSHSWPNRLLFARSGAPSAPTAATAATRSKAPHAITLRWGPPAHSYGSPVTGYVVTRSGTDAAGTSFTPVKLPVSARTYTFARLRHRQPYTVTVRAVNAVGLGDLSSRPVTTR